MDKEMEKIKYNGVELEEITVPQVFEKKPIMLVWDDDSYCEPVERLIAAIVEVRKSKTVAVDVLGNVWEHCANIPEKPAPRRATNRELSKWLAQGNGEWTDISKCVMSTRNYPQDYEKEFVPPKISIRKWGDNEWHEPTVDYMEIP